MDALGRRRLLRSATVCDSGELAETSVPFYSLVRLHQDSLPPTQEAADVCRRAAANVDLQVATSTEAAVEDFFIEIKSNKKHQCCFKATVSVLVRTRHYAGD